MADLVGDGGRCPNCGQSAPDRFCSGCGQTQGDLLPTVREVIRDAFSETLELDGKLPRTLRALAWPPGQLTTEWLRGRRVSFVSPLRLYVVAALVFFFAWPATVPGDLVEAFTQVFVEGVTESTAVETDMRLATQVITESLPGMTIVILVPLFGALLYWANLRRRPFVADLVTAVHLHVAIFLAAVLTTPLQSLGGIWENIAETLFVVGVLAFTVASIARAYHVGPWRAALRTGAVGVTYVVVIGLLLGGALGIVL